jgi:hypothetical protein
MVDCPGHRRAPRCKGPEQGVHATLAALQERIAILPDYAFRKNEALQGSLAGSPWDGEPADPESQLGSSVSGSSAVCWRCCWHS